MNFVSTFSKLGRLVGSAIKRNAPQILTYCTLGGLATTVVLSVDGTVKAVKVVEEVKKETGKDKLSVKETVSATWKCYVPTACSMTMTSAFAVASLKESQRRTAALATAYQIAETAREEFREAAGDIVGKKKLEEIDAKAAETNMSRDEVDIEKDIALTKYGTHLFKDSITGRYFRSSYEAVKQAQNDFNQALLQYDCLDLNDFYYRLEIESDTEVGKVLGLNIDRGLLDIYFTDVHHYITHEPCTLINYHNMPFYMFDRLVY